MPEIGFQRNQLISVAHLRTDGRAKSLDINAEFALALQEVCLDMRWWWRRKIASFTLTGGTSQYQLTGDGSLAIPDLQQIPRDGFKIYDGGGGGKFITLNPVFDMEMQQVITSFQSLQLPNRPTQYFLTGAKPGFLWIDPKPDRDYLASLCYWAMPIYNLGGESGEEEDIPMIPPYLHGLLLKRLEMRFLRTNDLDRYAVVVKEYEDMKSNADQFENFAEGQVRSFAAEDYNDSVRSS